MRLLFYIEHFGRTGAGAENYAAATCEALANRGHDVHVVCRSAAAAVAGVSVHLGFDRIPACTAELTPDLTFDWGLFAPADLHRLGGSIHRQFLRYSRDAYGGWLRVAKTLAYRGPRHGAIIRAETRVLQGPHAHFIAISEFVAEQARAEGLPADRITVLHNAVDTDRFRPPSDPAARKNLRRELGYKPADVVFLFVAHNLRLKNFALLRHLFTELTQVHPQARLAVLGKRRPNRQPDWLRHIPTSPRPETVYQAADVLVHPTYFDTFGSAVLEAMSTGLPVVVSNRAGAAELIRDGSNGFVLPVTGSRIGVRRKWCETLSSMLDAAVRHDLGRHGRDTAEAHAFPAHIDQMHSLLQQVRKRARQR